MEENFKDYVQRIAGAQVGRRELEELKKSFKKKLSGTAVSQEELNRIKNDKLKDMSGAAVSEGELERFEKIIPSVENKMGGGMMEDPMGYKTGGAIEVGKGKDYIKDLL